VAHHLSLWQVAMGFEEFMTFIKIPNAYASDVAVRTPAAALRHGWRAGRRRGPYRHRRSTRIADGRRPFASRSRRRGLVADPMLGEELLRAEAVASGCVRRRRSQRQPGGGCAACSRSPSTYRYWPSDDTAASTVPGSVGVVPSGVMVPSRSGSS